MSCGVAPGLTMKREPAALGLFVLARIENGAGADDRLRHFLRDSADGVESGSGPQCDLDCRKATCGQRARQGNGIGNILDKNDRNDRLALEDGKQ